MTVSDDDKQVSALSGAGVEVEKKGGLLLITIRRDAVRNSLDSAASAAVDRAVDYGEIDPGIGVILLTGEGDRAFCSGMDIKEAAATRVGGGLIPGRGFAGITERRRSKPLIAAVNGSAIAGGFEIALASDMVIAAEHARFGLSEVKLGLFAFAGGIQRLARAVPRAAALGMILSGEALPASRLYELGLVTEVVPTGEAKTRAIALAETILSYSGAAVRNAKFLHDMAADAAIDHSLAFGRAFGEATLASSDTREGLDAFVQKRDPDFKG